MNTSHQESESLTTGRIDELIATYRDGLLEDVLSFWTKNSVDRKCGGFTMCLNHDGSILDTDKSVWKQGRFTWLLGEMYNTTGNSSYPNTDVGAYTVSASPYGTFDQGGNVWEWNGYVLPRFPGRRLGLVWRRQQSIDRSRGVKKLHRVVTAFQITFTR